MSTATHRLVDVDPDRDTSGRFVCDGDQTSDCHQYPSCECELWPCGHDNEPHEECWVEPWINASDLSDTSVDGDPPTRNGLVKWSGEGDYVTWEYLPEPVA